MFTITYSVYLNILGHLLDLCSDSYERSNAACIATIKDIFIRKPIVTQLKRKIIIWLKKKYIFLKLHWPTGSTVLKKFDVAGWYVIRIYKKKQFHRQVDNSGLINGLKRVNVNKYPTNVKTKWFICIIKKMIISKQSLKKKINS